MTRPKTLARVRRKVPAEVLRFLRYLLSILNTSFQQMVNGFLVRTDTQRIHCLKQHLIGERPSSHCLIARAGEPPPVFIWWIASLREGICITPHGLRLYERCVGT